MSQKNITELSYAAGHYDSNQTCSEKLSIQRIFNGLGYSEIKDLPLAELKNYLDARARRCINRGLVQKYQKVYKNFQKKLERGAVYRTHVRNLIVLPVLVGHTIGVHCGRGYTPVVISAEMLGRKIGEFAPTKVKVKHTGKKGIGATKGNSKAK